jgi:uncharacterized protein YeaO (DUF488 family)
MGNIRLARIHAPDPEASGRVYLVDRLWPRGVRKDSVQLDGWLKDVAPSPELRRWFGHDPERWEEFRRRYFVELDARPESWQPLLDALRRGDVTLLYAARDQEHNNAVALRDFLEARRDRSR